MLTVITSRLARVASIFAVASLLLFSSTVAQAYVPTPYGRNVYGTCVYGCAYPSQPQSPPSNPTPPSTPTTTTTTPSGLEVAINLSNGQVIPSSGYTITVTPLNGQGSSFQKVDIYIDGQLVATVTPGADGTAHWDWDPTKYPGTDIKIIVTDTSGGTTTKEYTITIGDPTGAGSSSDSSNNTGNEGGLTGFITTVFTAPAKVVGDIVQSIGSFSGGLVETAENIVRALPAPVVYGFPYFLFLLLAIALALLSMQAFREVHEYRVLQELVKRGQLVADSKKTLAQLVSHYLRTPLTLIMGGVDALSQDPTVQDAAKEFEKITTRIHLKIEALIAETVDAVEAATEDVAEPPSRASIFRQRGMFIPMILMPMILIPFNYLVANAGEFTVTQTNIAMQVIIFAIFMTVIYQVLRRVQLRRRNTEKLQRILDAEEAINTSRDKLISGATDALAEDIGQIDALLNSVSSNEASHFIRTGQERFSEMLSKLRVATRLKGAHTTAPYADTTFSAIAQTALQNTKTAAEEHHVAIAQTPDSPVHVQSPELISFVLQNLIDNAIAYSEDKGNVELGVTTDQTRTTFTVTDHGSGIEPEKLPLLFQPFSKAEGAEVFTHEGMGFNLYLDKLVAEYLGGTIDVQSKPHQATTITLTVPQQATA